MLVILPPSETKRAGGVGQLDPHALSHARPLGNARERVREALEALCVDPDEAARVLKLGVKARGEIGLNQALGTSGTLPAIERYTGVLYDALDVLSLGGAAREWIGRHVAVQSALFGLLAADDLIPAYRLSAGSRLPELGASLKSVWQQAHLEGIWNSDTWVLDLRSKDYAALAPLPAELGAPLAVAQRTADGQVRALNHFNKAAKGDLVRRLARSGAEISSAGEFADWAREQGLEVHVEAGSGALTLVTTLGAAPSGQASASGARSAG